MPRNLEFITFAGYVDAAKCHGNVKKVRANALALTIIAMTMNWVYAYHWNCIIQNLVYIVMSVTVIVDVLTQRDK